MKKVLATLMAAALAVSMTACAVPAPAASAPAAAPAEEAAAEAPAAPAAEGETTLTMWCIATESDANRPAYEQAIAEY